MKKWSLHALMGALLALFVAMPLAAQDEFTIQPVELEPFIDTQLDIQGLRPTDWMESPQAPGVYVRGRDVTDRTALIIQAVDASAEEFSEILQAQFQLDALPEVGARATDAFTWTLFNATFEASEQPVQLDVAMTTFNEQTIIVMLQANNEIYERMAAEVFVPVVDSIVPLEYFEDPNGYFSLPIPEGWTQAYDEETSIVTFTSPDETVTVYAQAADGVPPVDAIVALWNTVAPDVETPLDEENVTLINDPQQLGGLDSVIITNFAPESPIIRQSVARLYRGVVYLLVIDTNVDAFRDNREAVRVLDSNYGIFALSQDQAEAENTDEASDAATD